jgi:hypothetical protein
MASNPCTAASAVLLATIASVVAAQTAKAPPPAASAASGAEISAYRSAFDGYRAFSEQPLDAWREANDRVGQIGGWQVYAREAQGGAMGGSASAVKGADSKPAVQGMEGHGISGTIRPGSAPAEAASGSGAASAALPRKTP